MKPTLNFTNKMKLYTTCVITKIQLILTTRCLSAIPINKAFTNSSNQHIQYLSRPYIPKAKAKAQNTNLPKKVPSGNINFMFNHIESQVDHIQAKQSPLRLHGEGMSQKKKTKKKKERERERKGHHPTETRQNGVENSWVYMQKA